MLPIGFLAGAWYGVIRFFREIMRSGPILGALCDIVAAIGIWLLAVAGIVAACYGEIRLYALIGIAAGFALERYTLGKVWNLAKLTYGKACKIIRLWQEKRARTAK